VPYAALAPQRIQLTIGELPIYLHMQLPDPATALLVSSGALAMIPRTQWRELGRSHQR
jgi:hypothetical protein